MCGIAGILSPSCPPEERRALLGRMGKALAHRGPDDSGEWLSAEGSPDVGLVHRRLSIIDLAGGRQPMTNEDGSLQLVLNGEIYNHVSLRTELESKGHRFRSRCDAEAVLHLYEQEFERTGPGFLNRLHGMFAFALWDARNRRLFMARDRLGKKPLVYINQGGTFLFASEIKALLEWGGYRRNVDRESLGQYLSYQYVPAPRTMFEGIQKLPPASWLRWTEGNITTNRYWWPSGERLSGNVWEGAPSPDRGRPGRGPEAPPTACHRVNKPGYPDGKDEIRQVLATAVEDRLVSDVPVGAFLSGGIDSSIVVGLMAEAARKRGLPPPSTFSIGFEEEAYTELPYAESVAKRFGTDHHAFTVRPDALELLPLLTHHYDEPFGDSSAIPTFYLARETRKHVKVVLSGDGGDECFGGYDRYRALRMSEWVPGFAGALLARAGGGAAPGWLSRRRWGRKLKKFIRHLDKPADRRYFEWMSIFDSDAKGALLAPGAPWGWPGGREGDPFISTSYREAGNDPVRSASHADLLTYLPGDLLVKVDIASMAHGLEVRSPFLDHRVVELAHSLPSAWKVTYGAGKRILKEAVRDLFPPEILNRRKQGFGVPLAEWFRGPLRELLGDLVLSPRSLGRGHFRPEAVRALAEEHARGEDDHSHRLWMLVAMEAWLRRFIDSPGVSAGGKDSA